MKKCVSFLLVLVLAVLSGCSGNSSVKSYSGGEVTELSKMYLSKGYSVSISRSMTSLGEDAENYGKAYVTMAFTILTEYTSNMPSGYSPDNDIKKMVISNVRVVSTPKMGIADGLYIMDTSKPEPDSSIEVLGTKNYYTYEYPTPHSFGVQSGVKVELNQIALYDITKSPAAANGAQPTMDQVYGELGITSAQVATVIGFRIELFMVGGKTLYKDFEITVPPTGIDIGSSEFLYNYFVTDINQMEPFLEKP